MKTTHDMMRERMYIRAGIIKPKPMPSLEELRESEWCEEFEKYMRNRLLMGSFRYGRMCAPGKPKYDRVPSMIKRLEQYAKTGNQENLVDVANLCMMEFLEGAHPNAHFDAVDDGHHCEVKG